MVKRTTFLILTLLVVSSCIFAQTGRISGIIKDAETNQMLFGANILVKGTILGASSDNEGKFRVIGISPGTYVVKISAIGYTPVEKTVSVTAGGETTLEIALQPSAIELHGVTVTESRAVERETPVSFSNMPQDQIRVAYTTQDVPLLIRRLPGVFAVSNSGIGLGDSEVRIRGFFQDRVQLTLNGIPENDPESHRVYWNDFPDLVSNVADIQVQRGVGSSLVGGSDALAGSINLETSGFTKNPSVELFGGYGSYRTRRTSLSVSSGLLGGGVYNLYGRFSKILSDGYLDRSGADLWSYFFSAARYFENGTLKLNVYGGPMDNHYARRGITKAQIDTISQGRQFNVESTEWYTNPKTGISYFNPAASGELVNRFNQPHYEMILDWIFSDKLKMNSKIFYIRGFGFGTSLPLAASTQTYLLQDTVTVGNTKYTKGNFLARSWTDNYQFGTITRFDYRLEEHDLAAGIEARYWWADHFGTVDFSSIGLGIYNNQNTAFRWYDYLGNKITASGFLHGLWRFGNLNLMTDIQYIHHEFILTENILPLTENQKAAIRANIAKGFKQRDPDKLLDNKHTPYDFISPKIGVNYNVTNEVNVFANFSQTHREPAQGAVYNNGNVRDDLVQEDVNDFELGAGFRNDFARVKMNLYYMRYDNEIANVYDPTHPFAQPSGSSAGFVTKNIGKTKHQGIELEATVSLNRWVKGLLLGANFSLNDNRFVERKDSIYNNLLTPGTGVQKYNEVIDYTDKIVAGHPKMLGNFNINYSGIEDAFLDLNVNFVGEQEIFDYNDGPKVPSYATLDFAAGYTFTNVLGLSKIQIGFNVNNILDSKYFQRSLTASTIRDQTVAVPGLGTQKLQSLSTGDIDYYYVKYFPAPERNFFVSVRLGI